MKLGRPARSNMTRHDQLGGRDRRPLLRGLSRNTGTPVAVMLRRCERAIRHVRTSFSRVRAIARTDCLPPNGNSFAVSMIVTEDQAAARRSLERSRIGFPPGG